MLSKNVQELYLKDIKQIEKKIQDVYYIGQFEIAKEFERKINEIKTYLLQASCGEKFDHEAKWYLSKEIVYLEFDINLFFNQKGNYIKEKQKIHTLEENLDKIINKDINKRDKKLWEDLSDITTKWNQQGNSTLTNQEANNVIAKAVLRIYEEQAKRGEKIELDKISKYCLIENFIYIVKNELIHVAQNQEKNKQEETLKLARELTKENLKNPLIWKKLTQLENINIVNEKNVNLQEQSEVKSLKENNTNTLLALKNQDEELSNNLLELIRNKIAYWRKYYVKYDTKYILADVDEKTGTYRNVRIRWGNLETFDKFNINKKRKIIQIITDAKEIKYKFHECENLREVTFLDDVETICNSALSKCKKLKKVTMGKGIKKIPVSCFYGSSIEDIEVHGYLEKIDDSAFGSCENLHSIELKEGLKSIGGFAFTDSGIEEIEIPDSVILIGEYIFLKCEKLKKAIIGKRIEEIPKGCFYGSSIKDIEVHGILINIRAEAFRDCKNLHSIELKEGLKSIGRYAFSNSGLGKIKIPDSVLEMEVYETYSDSVLEMEQYEKYSKLTRCKEFIARCEILNNKEYERF